MITSDVIRRSERPNNSALLKKQLEKHLKYTKGNTYIVLIDNRQFAK